MHVIYSNIMLNVRALLNKWSTIISTVIAMYYFNNVKMVIGLLSKWFVFARGRQYRYFALFIILCKYIDIPRYIYSNVIIAF